MAFIGPLLLVIGLIVMLPVVPIPGLAHISATIKGIGRIAGPAGYVFIILGAILWSYGI
ncbi:MAG: hypothetical protein ABIE94_00735 [archaeon]